MLDFWGGNNPFVILTALFVGIQWGAAARDRRFEFRWYILDAVNRHCAERRDADTDVLRLSDTCKQGGYIGNFVRIHHALDDLEAKGLVKSDYREGPPSRGGRKKRFISITETGRKAVYIPKI